MEQDIAPNSAVAPLRAELMDGVVSSPSCPRHPSPQPAPLRFGGSSAREPFTKQRLIGFLCLHVCAFSAEIVALANFGATGRAGFCWLLLIPVLSSGCFCSHAAWHCEAPVWAPRCLPLKNWPFPVALLLALPLGLCQGVIVILALEDYSARCRSAGLSVALHSTQAMTNKYHLKVVHGLFEGLIFSFLLLYAFWTIGFPEDHPIVPFGWTGERTLLAALGWILLLSSGLAVQELDFCTSRIIARKMRKSLLYELIHAFFRTTEVVTRLCMYIWFMATVEEACWWWWLPLAADFGATLFLVTAYGGVEAAVSVRLLCSVPCLFVNIFLFIDSPYKRRAARRLSQRLTVKNAATMVILPALTIFGRSSSEDLASDWSVHKVVIVGAIAGFPTYWFLLWWITARSVHRHQMPDIYTACENGSVAAVRSAMRDLTHSAAVGLNVNVADTDGNTPLMLAAGNGHHKVCRLLLQEGASISVRLCCFRAHRCLRASVRRRWTALHMAAHGNHAKVLSELLDGPVSSGAVTPVHESDLDNFQDTVGDTPLHVAARAGSAEAAAVLVTRRPAWANVVNCAGERPLDLARTPEVQQAISRPNLLEGSAQRRSPLLRGSDAQLAHPQHWPQVELQIARTSKDSQLMAPGLCSYVASSCGGALGRIFLANVPSQQEHFGHSVLTSISEATEDDPGTQTPGSCRHAWFASAPAIDDLEPIDEAGEPIERYLVGARRGQLRPSARGGPTRGEEAFRRNFSKVPYEAVLGEGSYGLVWRAKDKNTNTWYAVKNIKPSRRGAPSIATRECEVADHIRLKPHPCIVHLFHVHNFTDTGLYSLVMEFCPGGDLLGRIRAAKREATRQRRTYRPPNQAMHWIGQVFLGLEHMHVRMDTLLRDLKPENVVLSSCGHAKLTDFGFGRFGVESTGMWSFGIPTGSPGYVAPEVLQREEYDSRADLYSLGVLVWVLLTGSYQSSAEPVPPISRMRSPTDFEALFEDCHRLADCIQYPERHGVRALDSMSRDFVMRLTCRRPESRMLHAEIRAHSFLESVRLPAAEAPPGDVDAWLRTAPVSR